MEIEILLKNLGLSDKEIVIYLALINLGSSSVRQLADTSKINRGTAYDILRSLMDRGLVTYYHKETKQYFVAEPPEKLLGVIEGYEANIKTTKQNVIENLPRLQALFEKSGNRPAVKYYEGTKGMQQILQDVLDVMKLQDDKTYYVYSSGTALERKHLYESMPDFNKKRIAKNIAVNVISFSEEGQVSGLDERRTILTSVLTDEKVTHEIIYGGRIAHIGHNVAGSSIGVVIENNPIYTMQKTIFKSLWDRLGQ